MIAPVAYRVVREVLPNDPRSVWVTARRMQERVEAARHDPAMRRAAEWIVRSAPGGFEGAELAAIYHFMRRHVQYRRDPRWYEQLTDPRVLLARIDRFGWAAEDCDGHCMLVATLGLQLDLPMGLAFVAAERSLLPEHTYGVAQLGTPDLSWTQGSVEVPSGLVACDSGTPRGLGAFGAHPSGGARFVLPALPE